MKANLQTEQSARTLQITKNLQYIFVQKPQKMKNTKQSESDTANQKVALEKPHFFWSFRR